MRKITILGVNWQPHGSFVQLVNAPDSAYAALNKTGLDWIRFQYKDRVIAILRLNGFEVEDRT